MANVEKMIAETFLEMAQGLESGSYGKRPKIALTGMGSEHGEENAMKAALMAKMALMYIISDHLRQRELQQLKLQMTKKATRRWKRCLQMEK